MCAYPGCERTPRPAASEGRGSKPKYCDLTDSSGRHEHTAMTAFRARAALDRRAAGSAAPDDLDRPVTMTTARASELRAGLLSDAAALAEAQAAADLAAEQARQEAGQARAEAADLVRAAGTARNQARADAGQAGQRAAAAEARAEDARAETARARDDAARELGQLRADAERERDEILARLTDTARRLAEVTTARAGSQRNCASRYCG